MLLAVHAVVPRCARERQRLPVLAFDGAVAVARELCAVLEEEGELEVGGEVWEVGCGAGLGGDVGEGERGEMMGWNGGEFEGEEGGEGGRGEGAVGLWGRRGGGYGWSG